MTGTSYPDFTVNRSTVEGWIFRFTESSNVTLDRSSTSLRLSGGQARLTSYDSSIGQLDVWDDGLAELVNTTTAFLTVSDNGRVWIHWYLDVHVVDSIDQDVPMAEVVAEFANGTQAATTQTDDVGRGTLILLEKMVNASGSYPEEPYTVTAIYETLMNEETVEMNLDKELTIQLPFVIPELPLTTLTIVVASIMLVAVLLLKRSLPSSA